MRKKLIDAVLFILLGFLIGFTTSDWIAQHIASKKGLQQIADSYQRAIAERQP